MTPYLNHRIQNGGKLVGKIRRNATRVSSDQNGAHRKQRVVTVIHQLQLDAIRRKSQLMLHRTAMNKQNTFEYLIMYSFVNCQ